MADNSSHLGTTVHVRDVSDGKLATVNITEPEVLNMDIGVEQIMDLRARATAIVGAGVAKTGFFRSLDIRLQAPKLRRRTEIIEKDNVEDDLWDYEIIVRSGVVFE